MALPLFAVIYLFLYFFIFVAVTNLAYVFVVKELEYQALAIILIYHYLWYYQFTVDGSFAYFYAKLGSLLKYAYAASFIFVNFYFNYIVIKDLCLIQEWNITENIYQDICEIFFVIKPKFIYFLEEYNDPSRAMLDVNFCYIDLDLMFDFIICNPIIF